MNAAEETNPRDLHDRVMIRLTHHRQELAALTARIDREMEKELRQRSLPQLLVLNREADRRRLLIDELEREILGVRKSGDAATEGDL